MNNIKVLIGIVLSFFAMSLGAQNYEDILRYSQPKYSGTARSMSMGGAFGSLGGDFSALGINPAGIATYRSSEFSLTPSIILNSTESNFSNTTMNENKTTFAVNQIGFVGTYRPMREVKKGIVSSHFAIGYSRNNNFNYKSMASARELTTSMTDMFRSEAQGILPDALGGFGNLTGIAYNAYLLDYVENEDRYTAYTKDNDRFNQTRIIEKDGYSGEINLTAGVNISNILLLGASVNFTMLSYLESSNYYEEFNADVQFLDDRVFNRFTIDNHLDVSGNGINVKIGAIVKPTEQFRIGLSYHSSTWMNVEEEYGTGIDALYFVDITTPNGNANQISHTNYDGSYNTFDYKIKTPDKIVASASYVIGKKAIVSFDYEYINYSNAKFKTDAITYDDVIAISEQNENIKNIFTSTNNFRAGLEYRLTQQFSLRGGYSLQASPLGNSDYNINTMYGVHQLSDFKDNFKITGISGGLGYRNKNYFIDFAYRLSSYDHSYFNFDWPENVNTELDTPLKTEVKTKDHNASLTVGWKF